MKITEFLTEYNGKVIPKELDEFNWGAFLLTFIWGVPHKAWITLLAIPLMIIQMPFAFNWILLGIFQIYLGFNGNRIAFQQNWWMKPSDFRKNQMIWAISGFVFAFVVPIILFLIISRFISKSPDNLTEFAQNTLCSVSYKKVKSVLPKITLARANSPHEFVMMMAEHVKDAKADGNSLVFGVNSTDFSDLYVISVELFNPACSLKKANCVIKATYNLPIDTVSVDSCIYYIDEKKNLIPDKNTEKRLKKGINILKYL